MFCDCHISLLTELGLSGVAVASYKYLAPDEAKTLLM